MSDITGVSLSTTIQDLCSSMKSRNAGKNVKALPANAMPANAMPANAMPANAMPANNRSKLEPCYYTFTGDLCPGPSFDQCPAGSRCDTDVGACVSAPRADCISDLDKRGPMPEGASPQGIPGNDGTAGNGGGRRRTYRKKGGRRSRISRKMRRKY